MQKIKILILLIFVFFLAISVWYSPILFKGHNLQTTASHALVRAKNFAISNNYASENKLNVILSPDLISQEGQQSYYGNKQGTIFYSYLIRFFNLNNNHKVVLANCIILALALIFFTLTVYYLFGFKISFIFSLIYIFLPSNWHAPQILIGYEIPLLFLSIFFLFFSIGTKKFVKDEYRIKLTKFYPQGICLIFSGIFLALTCLTREAFFLLPFILFLFLLFYKLKKYLLYIFIPLIIIIAIFWLPSFIKGENTYALLFTDKTTEKLKSSDIAYYAHLFPDPYTYHFAKEEHLTKKRTGIENADLMGEIGQQKVMKNMGFASVGIVQRSKIGTTLFVRHLFRFLSISEIGGPLIFILFILGLSVLKKRNSYWYKFYLSWIIGSLFLLAYVNLAGRNHIMDFGLPIALISALGIILFSNSLAYNFKNKKVFFTIITTLLIIYNLVLSTHVMFGQQYDKSTIPKINAYIDIIKEKDIDKNEIIAMPAETVNDAYNINFNTGNSVVLFKIQTIKQLIAEENLNQAFEKFNVKYIIGYSPELSKTIFDLTNTEIIANNTLSSIKKPSEQINNKNWFMNLVK